MMAIGDIVILTNGEYSNYLTLLFCKALKVIDKTIVVTAGVYDT